MAVHFEPSGEDCPVDDRHAACGLGPDAFWWGTRIQEEVTCRRCKRTRVFRESCPHCGATPCLGQID